MLRLSEAIRLGAMLRPQVFGAEYTTRPRGILGLSEERVGSCAMGAALEAGGCPRTPNLGGSTQVMRSGGTTSGMAFMVPTTWYDLLASETTCPACDAPDPMVRIITHLNDDHHWPREAIAVWVATLEADQPADVEHEAGVTC